MKKPLLVTALLAAGFVLAPATADAADWVDRPLTLGLLGFTADAALGFAQGIGANGGTTVGTGANLQAAVGLPLGFEVGLRLGLPFGDDGKAAMADQMGRLYDPIGYYESYVGHGAGSSVSQPEIRVQKGIVDVGFAALAAELRLAIPSGGGSYSVLTPGARARFRFPGVMRLDVGMYFPMSFADSTPYSVDVPIALWFQAGGLFVGPEAGLFYTHFPTGGSSPTDIRAGVGIGHTFNGMFDVKAELVANRINDSDWSKSIAGGIGVGVYIP